MNTTTFTDTANREWSLKFSFGAAKRICSATGCDCIDSSKADRLTLMLQDREKLGDALWELIEKQAIEQDVDKDSFHDALSGDVLNEASASLCESFIQYCSKEQQSAVREVFAKQTAAIKTAADSLVEQLRSPEFDAQVDKEIKREMESHINNLFKS